MGDLITTIMRINRQWIFMLKDGTAALDWGEGMAQELLSGKFSCYTPDEYSHVLRDEEILPLIGAGRITSFNAQQVAIRAWPPR